MHPSFPKIKLFVVLTLILGLLLGIGMALLIEILNPVVHSPLDIIEQLALPVFAVVPYSARSRDASTAVPRCWVAPASFFPPPESEAMNSSTDAIFIANQRAMPRSGAFHRAAS